MDVLGILANPGFGNLLLLIAAMIGVLGSYRIYQIRLNDRKKSTRRALKAEIESNGLLDTWIRQKDHGSEPPAQVIHPTTVYEGKIEDIGLLTDEEIDMVSEFYSKAILMNDVLKWNREFDLQISLKTNTVDTGRERRVHDISEGLERLAVFRWKAVQILKKHLGEEHESIGRMELPTSAGETVSKYHPVIHSRIEELVDDGHLEQVDTDQDLYRLTDKGEQLFGTDFGSHEDYDLDHELSLRE